MIRAFAGEARPEAFLLKILFTSVTREPGTREEILHRPSSPELRWAVSWRRSADGPVLFGAGLGLAGVFCGVTNCPLTSILLAYELVRRGRSAALYTVLCGLLYAVGVLQSVRRPEDSLFQFLGAEYCRKPLTASYYI